MLYFKNNFGEIQIVNEYVHVTTEYFTKSICVLDGNITALFLLAELEEIELKKFAEYM